MIAWTLPAPRPCAVLLVLAALVTPLTAGCSALSRHSSKKIPQYGVIDPSLPRELHKVSMPSHVVEPSDELEVAVKPPLSDLANRSVTVQPDGTIDLGFQGDYYVAGLTVNQVELKLAQNLSLLPERKDAKEPLQVSVRLTNIGETKRFYVLGTVTNPNSYPLQGNETVLDGILQAGLRSNSLPDKAYLVRPHPAGGPDQIFRIDWFGITQRGDTLTNYQLMPGDRIYVPGGSPPGLLRSLVGGG